MQTAKEMWEEHPDLPVVVLSAQCVLVQPLETDAGLTIPIPLKSMGKLLLALLGPQFCT